MWPRGGVAPTDLQSKRDYFDSLYHAKAVIGINTTALVDSAIVRRPVFTMVSDHFRSTQTGTLHFSYLARDGGGGLLSVARSWDEHFRQLGGAMRSVDGHRDRIDGFLRTFVRPHGLDRPAAPLALDAIVEMAHTKKEPVSEGGVFRWIVGTTARALGRLHRLLGDLRPEPLRKRLNRRRKLRAQAERRRDRQPKASGGAKPAKADRAAIKAERAAAKAERAKEKAGSERTG